MHEPFFVQLLTGRFYDIRLVDNYYYLDSIDGDDDDDDENVV